jgi:predicted enzyme related to lactoylglutathione lyase
MEHSTDNPNNPVVWFEIYVDDINRAKKFYETVLAVKMNEMADASKQGLQMVSFQMKTDKPNASGALIKMEGVKPGGNSTIVYFASTDCSIEENRVEKAGGKIFKKKMSIGEYGFMSLCFDSEGNMFGLHSGK